MRETAGWGELDGSEQVGEYEVEVRWMPEGGDMGIGAGAASSTTCGIACLPLTRWQWSRSTSSSRLAADERSDGGSSTRLNQDGIWLEKQGDILPHELRAHPLRPPRQRAAGGTGEVDGDGARLYGVRAGDTVVLKEEEHGTKKTRVFWYVQNYLVLQVGLRS
jgi:hypothetical protein